MIKYLNTSVTTKTFWGVTFKPGEAKEVKGYINDPAFVRLPTMPVEPPKASDKPEVAEKTTTAVGDKKPKQGQEGQKTNG